MTHEEDSIHGLLNKYFGILPLRNTNRSQSLEGLQQAQQPHVHSDIFFCFSPGTEPI